MNIFETASRLRLRFNVGTLSNLTVEDLWALPLVGNKDNNLDALAIKLNAELEKEKPQSFVRANVQKTDKETALSFEIVKHIIDVRVAEEEAQRNAMVKQAQRSQLQQLKAQKQLQELENLSLEEIDQRLKDLED